MRICVANKATGMDKIKNEFIKYGGDEMVEALVMMMNVLWEKERIPDEWLNANIIPIHKADDTHIPNNYRPISLTSVVGKVYEKIIEERITKWLEKRDGIVEEQGGFRTGRGCMDQIWILNEVVQMRREKNKRTYLAFIDFKKAYDVVWRDALFYKIAAMGIRGKMWRVIRDMYREVRNSVLVNGLQSEWWASDKGTRQGSVLSPLLFSIAILDLIHRLKGNRCGVTVEGESIPGLLFADDLVLMAGEEDELRKAMHVLEEWSTQWRFIINNDKCGVIVAGESDKKAKERQREGRKWILKGQQVKEVEEYKYLGIQQQKRKGWSRYVNKVVEKGNSTIGDMTVIGIHQHGIRPSTAMRIVTTILRPQLEYGNQLLLLTNMERIGISNDKSRQKHTGRPPEH